MQLCRVVLTNGEDTQQIGLAMDSRDVCGMMQRLALLYPGYQLLSAQWLTPTEQISSIAA